MATHVQTLVHLLNRDGFRCTVFDYTKEIRNLFSMLVHSLDPNALLHVHVAYVKRFAWIAPIIGVLAAIRPVVISVHSGRFPNAILQAPAWRRRLLAPAFRRAQYVIAVSEDIRRAIINHLGADQTSVVVVGPFLGGTPTFAFAERRPGSVVASGNCIPLYGWLDLVRAARTLTEVSRVDLVMYNVIDEAYLTKLKQEISDDLRFHFHFNIPRAQFFDLLIASEMFLRPTYADGDSLALREALEKGCKVLASDCVARPSGVQVFKTGDVDALRVHLRALFQRKGTDRNVPDSSNEAYERLKMIYAAVK
jgi:glycosyltransferase involved in cell wall biosynthesis